MYTLIYIYSQIIKHQKSNLLIQHDFAHKHVLKTSQCLGTINGIISFKSFIEIGIGSLKIPLICSMENTYKKSLLSVRETLHKFLGIINFKIISETYFLTFFLKMRLPSYMLCLPDCMSKAAWSFGGQ